MYAALLSVIVAATPSTADEGSAARPPPPAPPSAADTVVAAAFTKDIDTKASALQPGPGAGTLLAPLLAIASLAGVAFALTRRRRSFGRNITLIETAALGPKRSLVIADVLGERLVLGVSEAGIAVLSTRPAPEPAALLVPPPVVAEPPAGVTSAALLERLFRRPAPPPATFDEAMRDSLEHEELRAKLALGQRGVAP